MQLTAQRLTQLNGITANGDAPLILIPPLSQPTSHPDAEEARGSLLALHGPSGAKRIYRQLLQQIVTALDLLEISTMA
jgi:hypothetical protein